MPRALLEELEPRILYSADLAAVLGAAGDGTGLHETGLATQNVELQHQAALAAPAHEIAFVDLAAPSAHELVAGLAAQHDNGRNIEIVTIAAGEDGLAVISQTLAGREGITAVHLLSHGSSGQVQLGTAVLDNTSALARAGELAAWSLALAPGADLLIYGCDVAASSSGQQLIQSLAALVGADVAASSDATGAARLGGDWQLEQHTGPIEAAAAADASLQATWDALLGTEFRVNSTTQDTQDTQSLNRGSQQAVSLDAQGNFVVVWTSKNQDGATDGVYARRFTFDGVALTPEIQVNSTTAGAQNMASVVSDNAGNFVVVWTGEEGSGNGKGVYMRRFSGSGTALTAEALVNTTSAGNQTNPVVSLNKVTGAFVVAWQGQGAVDNHGIYFRRYAANATALDAAQKAGNTSDAGPEQNPAVAIDSTGRVVVAYDVNKHMFFQRFDTAGVAAGGATQVDNSASDSIGAAMAMDDAGNFTLVYREQTTLSGIWGRGFNADGSQRYTWFYAATGDATSPSIAMAGNGAFVVTYEKTGTDMFDIFARKFNANGTANGAAFAVNAYTAGEQKAASVALLSKDDFVVVWSGEETADNNAVLARTFQAPPAAPVISSNGGAATAAVSLLENSTAVTTVVAADSNRPTQALAYSISGGADAARFSINASTGALRFVTAPDFETPLDSGANNVYDVTVQVSDGTLVDTQSLAVTVTDVGGPLTVTTFTDVLDGDTLSVEALLGNMGADGKISLREAITATNNTAGTDTILLGAGTHNLTIGGFNDDNNVNGDLDVRDSLVITGAGAAATAVSGGGSISVFHIISGTLTMSNLTVRDGWTPGNGAGIQVATGAALNLSQAVVRNNTAGIVGDGGGLFNEGALTLTDVELRDNSAAELGGGIVHLGTTMSLTRVTLAGNSAASGGGLYALGTGAMTLTNVTLSGNSAGSYGGGAAFDSSAALVSVTVANNSAGTSGGGLYIDQAPTVSLRNVLMSGNTGGNFTRNAGSYTSLGNNMSSEASTVLVQPGDRVSTPGNFSALADNGGFGRTHALLVSSQAVNNGSAAVGVPAADQRGVARAGNPDIGAYEFTGTPNQAPVNTLPATLALLEDQVTPVGGVSVSDPNLNDGLTATRLATTALNVGSGTLQVTLSGAATVSAGANNSASFTLSGSEADINATLATLRYLPSLHYNGGDTLVMTSTDGSAMIDSDSTNITVTAVNDAPSGSNATLSVDATLQRTLARADFGFSDVAADGHSFQSVLVQLPTQGTLLLSGTPLSAATEVAIAQVDAGALVFQAAADASGLGYATLQFQVRDSGGSANGGVDLDPTAATLNFDIANRAPVISSPANTATATITGPEGRAAVGVVTAADADADAVTIYSISGGADAGRFTIDGGTGELRFAATPDFETPLDAGADNTYVVTVQASDGTLADTITLSVVVTDVEHQISVTTTADVVDGNTSSIDALFTSPGADGEVSLREAMTAANNTPGLDSITFSINAPLVAGAHSIALTSALPAISSPVFINGRSEPDFAGTPVIEINGTGAGTGARGLRLDPGSDGSTLAGLAINRFDTDALQVWGSGGHTIVGNHLGTDVSGHLALGNTQAGLWMAGWASTIGGTAAGDGNVIAGNGGTGLQIDNAAQDIVVIGNRIGLGLGDEALGNMYGVRLDSGANKVRIGGTLAGEGNQIAHNSLNGIVLTAAAGNDNAWLGNSIHDNSQMAVDLGDDGATANDAGDADLGPNRLQNHPVLATAVTDGTDTKISGTLASAPSTTYRIEFYSAPLADVYGRGDGAVMLGATSISTNAAGTAAFNFTLTGIATSLGDVLSAVAVVDMGAGVYGSASEFSAVATVVGPNVAPVITSAGGADSATVNVAENSTAVGTVVASDSDVPAQTISYSIAGGADAARFAIHGSTGALSFIVAPVYGAPTDSDGNNRYEVVVEASDGTLTDNQALTVRVLSTSAVPLTTPDTYALVEDQPFSASVASGWFDASWSQRQAITFNNASGPVLSNVVVAVTLDSSTVDYTTIQNGGQDLRFVTPSGQVLAHEIERWDETGVSTVWVKVPTIGAASTTESIWMYSGNPTAADGQQVAATWPSVAKAVVHMGSTLADSSATNNVITQSGTTVVPGRIGQARQFDGLTSWVSLGSAAALDDLFLGGGTLSAWIRPTGWGEGGYGRVASKSDSLFAGGSNGNGWNLELSGPAQALIFEIGFSGNAGRWTTPSGSISLNSWQRVTVSYDNTSAANTPKVFIDDVQVALTRTSTPSGAPTSDAAMPLRLGNQALTTDRSFAGAIDDVRVYSVTASAASNSAGYQGAVGALVGGIGAPQRAVPGVLNNDDPRSGGALQAELLTGPSHAASFTLNSDGTFNYVPAADYFGADTFIYQARNATVAGSPVAVTLNIAGTPDAPVITTLGGAPTVGVSVQEGLNAVVAMTAIDADGPAPALTWSIAGGVDAAFFTVNGATGVLQFVAAPDFETPIDSGTDNTYDVVVQASDGSLVDTQALRVTVTDVNEFGVGAVADSDAAANTALEIASIGSAVGITARAVDADGSNNTVSYSLTNNDGGRFAINSSTGVVTLARVLGEEAAAVHTITVRADSSDGSFATSNFSVTAVPVNNQVPVITSGGGGANAVVTLAEGQNAVGTVVASDGDLPALPLSYRIAGGVDAARFTIDTASGALHFLVAPDFEAPTDNNGDGIYGVTVAAGDGVFEDQQALLITVTDVNEFGVGAVADSNTAANTALETASIGSPVGITARAVDADGSNNTVSYSLTNNDGGRFAINSSTGVVTLARVLGEEGAAVHTITVRADSSDGSFATSNFSVTAVPVNNQVPVITSGGGGATALVSIAEGQTVVGTLSATDADLPAQTLSYSITGGADAARFSVDGATGLLRFVNAPDFETPLDADGNGIYELTLAASDGTLQDLQAFSVRVLNVDEAPTWVNNSLVISEGGIARPALSALDVDSGPALLSFQVQGLAGGRFEYTAAPGVPITVFTQAELNAGQVVFVADGGEAAPSYGLVLSDSTSALPARGAAVSFTAVNDAPVAPARDLGVFDEDSSVVIDAASLLAGASDADGDPLVLSGLRLRSGNASLQNLGGGRWQLDPGANWNGSVTLDYEVSDGVAVAGNTAVWQVRAVNDAPQFTSFAGVPAARLSQPENGQAVAVLTAADIDTDPSALRFAISGGADAALFSIDARSGALSFIASPDHEAPADANGDGRYELVVAVSDGQAGSTQALSIAVDNVNEAPVVTQQQLELSAQGTSLVLQSSDPDSLRSDLVYEVLSVSGGHFEMTGTRGQVSASFTQADIDAGRVVFVDLKGADVPTFRLALSDGVNRIELPAPTVLQASAQAAPEAPTYTAPVATSQAPTDSREATPTPPAATTAVQAERPAVIGLVATDDTPATAYLPVGIGPLRPAAGPAGGNITSVGETPTVKPSNEPVGTSFWLQSIAALQADDRDVPLLRGLATTHLFSSSGAGSLAQAMDTVRLNEHAAQGNALQMDSASTVLVSSGLSVGYVLWLARGGALVASLMSSVPAWASVDPLPVLSQVRRERDGDEGAEGEEIDPVDRLFSRARRLLGTTPKPEPHGAGAEPGAADSAQAPLDRAGAHKQQQEPTWVS